MILYHLLREGFGIRIGLARKGELTRLDFHHVTDGNFCDEILR